jgi:hypothetical protein
MPLLRRGSAVRAHSVSAKILAEFHAAFPQRLQSLRHLESQSCDTGTRRSPRFQGSSDIWNSGLRVQGGQPRTFFHEPRTFFLGSTSSACRPFHMWTLGLQSKLLDFPVPCSQVPHLVSQVWVTCMAIFPQKECRFEQWNSGLRVPDGQFLPKSAQAGVLFTSTRLRRESCWKFQPPALSASVRPRRPEASRAGRAFRRRTGLR